MYRTTQQPTYKSKTWSHHPPIDGTPHASEVFLLRHGQTRCNGRFEMHQVLNELTFFLYLEGSGTLHMGDLRHPIKAGQMAVVVPGTHIHYYDRPEDPWHYQWFTLGGSGAVPMLKATGLPETSSLLKGNWLGQFSEFSFRTQKYYRSENPSFFRAMSLGLEFLSIIQDEVMGSKKPTKSSLSQHARMLMEQEFQTGLQVEEVASRLKVSRSTLFRHFMKEQGLSLKTFLDDLRLSQARKMVDHGHLHIQEVAYACGFRDPHYFSRVYRQRFGASPTR